MELARCDMNVERTARTLHYCRPVIDYHLESVCKLTGLNPKKFYDLVRLTQLIEKGEIGSVVENRARHLGNGG